MGEAKRRQQNDPLFGKGNAEKLRYLYKTDDTDHLNAFIESLPAAIEKYMNGDLRQKCRAAAKMHISKIWAVIDSSHKIYKADLQVITYAFSTSRWHSADTQLGYFLGEGLEMQDALCKFGFGTFETFDGQDFVVIFDPNLSDDIPDFFLEELEGEPMTHDEMSERIKALLNPARECDALSLAA